MASSSSSRESLLSSSADPVPQTRVIALIDVDSFECQVWQRMYPERGYWGKPCIVADKGGRIVSVTAEAKALGITREMRVQEARRVARDANPKLIVFTKPNDRNKPDGKTTRYASWEIVDALKRFVRSTENITIESGGSDEFYLDLTEEVNLRINHSDLFKPDFESQTFLEEEHDKLRGEKLENYVAATYRNINGDLKLLEEQKLIYGGVLMQDINNFIFRSTRFVASVGVGTNKLIAKIGVTLNKPNGITILTAAGLLRLNKGIPIEKIPGFGGKTGTKLKETFKIATMRELADIELEDLVEVVGEDKAFETYMKCRGLSYDPVTEKIMSCEVSCGKNFQRGEISTDLKLKQNVKFLSEEMFNERLGEELVRHKREPSCVRAHVLYTKIAKKIKSVDTTETSEEVQVDESLSWSYIIENLNVKNYLDIRDEVIEHFVEDVSIPIDAIRITRICLTARGFKSVSSD